MIDLKNKIIVITGATSGLGECLAKDFADRGGKVFSLSRSKSENPNSNITYVNCDITDKEKVFESIKKIGDVDIFVNNAGVWIPWAPIESQTKENVQKMIDVNFFGTMFCTQAVLPIFKNKKEGIFLNIISTSAFEPKPLSSGYAASKFAQDGFTKATRKSLEGSDVKVINIYPDGMKTDIFGNNKPDGYDSYMEPSLVSKKIVDFVVLGNGEEIIIKKE